MNLEQIVAEVQQEHRERMTERGRKRKAPKVKTIKKPAGFIFFCEECEREFHRAKRGFKFCSLTCQNSNRMKVSAEDLEPFVKAGETVARMMLKFGVSRDAIRRSMRKHGLYQPWQQARYAKCKVGNTQSTPRRESQIGTASSASAGNTPSARSEGRTVSAMSCG